MFWKKKNRTEELITVEDDERRNDVRIHPLSSISLSINRQLFPILDISASGLSFQNGNINPEQEAEIFIQLPDFSETETPGITIHCKLKILQCIEGICHCQFLNLSEDSQKELDLFILNEQKQQIRRHKFQAFNQQKP